MVVINNCLPIRFHATLQIEETPEEIHTVLQHAGTEHPGRSLSSTTANILVHADPATAGMQVPVLLVYTMIIDSLVDAGSGCASESDTDVLRPGINDLKR